MTDSRAMTEYLEQLIAENIGVRVKDRQAGIKWLLREAADGVNNLAGSSKQAELIPMLVCQIRCLTDMLED